MLKDAESYDVGVAAQKRANFHGPGHMTTPFSQSGISKHQHFKNLLILEFAGISLSDAYSDMHKLQNKSPRNNAMRFGKRVYKILAALTQSQAINAPGNGAVALMNGFKRILLDQS